LDSQYENCPLISLEEAINKAELIYNREGGRPATKLAIAKDMQYGNLHGTSYTVIAALTEYGLLTKASPEDHLQLSADALDILSVDRVKRAKAIQKAAFSPSLFSKLHESYVNALPDSAELATHFEQMRLHPNKINAAIQAYRNTIKFVNEEIKHSDVQSLGNMGTSTQAQTGIFKHISIENAERSNSIPSSTSSESEEIELIWRIAPDCVVQIGFKGHVTQEALQKLIAILELSRDDYPSRENVEERSV
jgi:hypothetical protein